MKIDDRAKRAFYDYLRNQIKDIYFNQTPTLMRCKIVTIGGESFLGQVPNEPNINLKRRAFVRGFKKLKAIYGDWVKSAFIDGDTYERK